MSPKLDFQAHGRPPRLGLGRNRDSFWRGVLATRPLQSTAYGEKNVDLEHVSWQRVQRRLKDLQSRCDALRNIACNAGRVQHASAGTPLLSVRAADCFRFAIPAEAISDWRSEGLEGRWLGGRKFFLMMFPFQSRSETYFLHPDLKSLLPNN